MDRTKGRNTQNHIMVGDFNIPLLVVDGTSRQKVSKNLELITPSANWTELTFTQHSTLGSKTHIPFKCSGIIHQNSVDHVLAHKTDLSKL